MKKKQTLGDHSLEGEGLTYEEFLPNELLREHLKSFRVGKVDRKKLMEERRKNKRKGT